VTDETRCLSNRALPCSDSCNRYRCNKDTDTDPTSDCESHSNADPKSDCNKEGNTDKEASCQEDETKSDRSLAITEVATTGI
jgi:hypothetical protein